jgi:hypothetical protein
MKHVTLAIGMVLIAIVLLALLQAPISSPGGFRNENQRSDRPAKGQSESGTEQPLSLSRYNAPVMRVPRVEELRGITSHFYR